MVIAYLQSFMSLNADPTALVPRQHPQVMGTVDVYTSSVSSSWSSLISVNPGPFSDNQRSNIINQSTSHPLSRVSMGYTIMLHEHHCNDFCESLVKHNSNFVGLRCIVNDLNILYSKRHLL